MDLVLPPPHPPGIPVGKQFSLISGCIDGNDPPCLQATAKKLAPQNIYKRRDALAP
jgi:hypothetical protein